MEILYSNKEYIDMLWDIYSNYKTYYAWGAFGAPANKKNRERYDVPDSVSPSTFLFDCSGFAYKAIPWGWCGDKTKTYGGATYNKIPTDTNFKKLCYDQTDDFSNEFKVNVSGFCIEVLKQDRNAPVRVEHQVIIIYAVTNGFLKDIQPENVKEFEKVLY